ncbi:MAG: MATE family efflux transporter [Saprospiraceae bacterium]|nr:MATE family efflux transporter [Saprospiraceae bacterium]MBK9221420.1 MATE family efflux transporter [Saprospiraceae bacterium]MBK9721642.1 MATE family efflux transporter [Saprospiraceae bacterium]MBK9728707.1 MATE family efflux transporter [Saprospiraceae bacterium]
MHEFWFNVRNVIRLSLPMMIGSAAQNIVALTDSLFLYYYDVNDFAAAGFVSVFYLVVSSIAFGISKGGQILIARKFGERNFDFVKKYFYAIFIYELLLGLIVFFALYFASRPILSVFIQSEIILEKSLLFLDKRIYGLIFAYVGLAFVSLYIGIKRTNFILIDTIILCSVNVLLGYLFVFGKFGFPEMGIAGAGLASGLSEIIAMSIFVVYMCFDKEIRVFKLLKIPHFDFAWIKTINSISFTILLQSLLAIGSWFLFFSMIEKLGERQLAISNLLRITYLVLAIPCWGYSTGINTLVSNTIGKKRHQRVLKLVFHSSMIAFATTAVISIPFLLFPMTFLAPLLGYHDVTLIQDAVPYFKILLCILLVYSITTMYCNGVSGTGETLKGLTIQAIGCTTYLTIAFFAVKDPVNGLAIAWSGEILYWLVQGFLSYKVLTSGTWNFLKI